MINKKKFQPSKILNQIKNKIEQSDSDTLNSKDAVNSKDIVNGKDTVNGKNAKQQDTQQSDIDTLKFEKEVNKTQNSIPQEEEEFLIEDDDEFDFEFDFSDKSQNTKSKTHQEKKEASFKRQPQNIVKSNTEDNINQKAEAKKKLETTKKQIKEEEQVKKGIVKEKKEPLESKDLEIAEMDAEAVRKEIDVTPQKTEDTSQKISEKGDTHDLVSKSIESDKLDFDEIVKNNSTLSNKNQNNFISKQKEDAEKVKIEEDTEKTKIEAGGKVEKVEKAEKLKDIEKKETKAKIPEIKIDAFETTKEKKKEKEAETETEKNKESVKKPASENKVKTEIKKARKSLHIKSDFSWDISPENITQEMSEYEDDDLDFEEDEIDEGFGESWDWDSEIPSTSKDYEEPKKERRKETQEPKEPTKKDSKEPKKEVEINTKTPIATEEKTKKVKEKEKPKAAKEVEKQKSKDAVTNVDMEDFLNQEIDEDDIKEKTRNIVGLRTWKEKPEELKEKESKEDEMVGIKDIAPQKEMKSDEELLKELLELEKEEERNNTQNKQEKTLIKKPITDERSLKQTQDNLPIEDTLSSKGTQEQVKNSIAEFSHMFPKKQELMPSQMFNEGQSVGQMVYNILEPKLEEWVNQNLPNMVEKVIKREIKKLIPKDED